MRHIGIVLLTTELAAQMFSPTEPKRWFRVSEGIPIDAEFRGHAFDVTRNCFIFFYEHPSFPPVEEGELIQHIIKVRVDFKYQH